LRTVWELVEKNGGPSAADAGWAARIRADAADPVVQSAVSALGVEPLKTAKEPDAAFVAAHAYGLQELTALRRIAEVKSRLQRTNPVEQATEYNRMFGELVALEQHRRTLRELAMGSQ
jgi:DNA primase